MNGYETACDNEETTHKNRLVKMDWESCLHDLKG